MKIVSTKVLKATAEWSASQVARMKKRCVDVLASSGSNDQNLQLCQLIPRRDFVLTVMRQRNTLKEAGASRYLSGKGHWRAGRTAS